MQIKKTPSRLYSAADLEAGPPPPGHDAAQDKQMDVFFKEVAEIKVGAYNNQPQKAYLPWLMGLSASMPWVHPIVDLALFTGTTIALL